MKAALILDKVPRDCRECPLYVHDFEDSVCTVEDKSIPYTGGTAYRPTWCPLRPLPDKKVEKHPAGFENVHWDNIWKRGWNACLKAIEGSGDDAEIH
ncbi:MAG: hypothetical protein LUE23_04360 [Lachnospiraceae bacterium]|nr:hypothetical protein [Lachnospiraceae bacterium]